MMVVVVVMMVVMMMMEVMVMAVMISSTSTTHHRRVIDDTKLVLLVRYLDDVFPWDMKFLRHLIINCYSLATVSDCHHMTLVHTVIPH